MQEVISKPETVEKYKFFAPTQPGRIDMERAYRFKRQIRLRNQRTNCQYTNNQSDSLITDNEMPPEKAPRFNMIDAKIGDKPMAS